MVRVFFSGTESLKTAKELAKRGIKHQLVSYLYLTKKGKNIEKELEERKKAGIKMFLDSGAHTLRQHAIDKGSIRGAGKKTKEGKERMGVQLISWYQRYVDDYIKFLKKYVHYFEVFVNVDIDNVVGCEQVEKWDDQIIKEVGREPLVVWHQQSGYHKIEEYAKKYKYIGLGRGQTMSRTAYFFTVCRKYKTKVHGFALTDHRSISRWPFYSVDSTSWLVGSMYGLTTVFKGRKTRGIPKTQRRNFRHYCEKNEIDFDRFTKDKNWEVDMFNACNWRDYIEHVNSYKSKLGIEYWNRK